MSTSQFHTIDILLIEDNLADVRLTVELLREARLANHLEVIRDGREALARLRDPVRTLPDLVLTDLGLPGLDGRTLLRQVRAEPRLASLPILVLTSSATHSEMVRDERLEADAYLEKPIDLQQFIAAVLRIDGFWLDLVREQPIV